MTELPEHLDLSSLDISNDKKKLLLSLFPEVQTEGGRIDFDLLKLALGEIVDVGKERYGMNWPGKADCFKAIQTPSLGTLLPCPAESVNFDTSENLIIEGDNLEVLKLMQKSYLGKVKMIYIDPPYNTGNDFIYPDDFRDSIKNYQEFTGQVDAGGRKYGSNNDTDGRFHTRWMNMMYPRLYLASNLLTDNGVIFISIDDNEASNLRKLCDEIFGEENFIATFIWFKKLTGGYDNENVNTQHEYIVLYSKNISNVKIIPEVKESNYKLVDENGKKYKWDSLWNIGGLTYSKSLDYPIIAPDGSEIWPIGERGVAFWLWSKDKVEKERSKLKFEKDKNGVWKVYKRVYASEGIVPGTMLDKEIVKGNTHSSAEIKDLFDGIKVFDYAKPTTLIKYIIERAAQENDIILDFFAGSGTTAQAIYELNKQDGGNRKFVLVQLPEPTGRQDYPTITEITKERVRRVIRKLNNSETGQLSLDTPQDRGFRVFKLDASNFQPWDSQTPKDAQTLVKQLGLHVEHILANRSQQDILYEILLKSGFPLTTPVETLTLGEKRVFRIAGGELLVCLDPELTMETIRAIASRKPERVVCLDAGFSGNDQLKANAVQTFKTQGIPSFKTV